MRSENHTFRKKSTVPILGHPEVEHILPIQLPEKNKEMFLFDLQTVGYWVSKNATKIAGIHAPGPVLLSDPATSNRGDQNLNRQESP